MIKMTTGKVVKAEVNNSAQVGLVPSLFLPMTVVESKFFQFGVCVCA